MTARIASGVREKTLTHEVGAGAPCLKCGDKCPGLDLHFWRKICRNCKCPQENHDVNTSVSSRGIDNIGKLLMQDKGENYKEKSAPKIEPPASSPEKKSKPTTVKVSAPPPAAPKPVKEANSTSTPVTKPPPPASSPEKKTDLNVTIDIGGKKHTLDFGSDLASESLPSPPPPIVGQEDFPAPPPPLEPQAPIEEIPPAVPPLPQEFQESVKISEEKPVKVESPKTSPKKSIEVQTGNDSAYDTDTIPPPSTNEEPRKSSLSSSSSSSSSSDDEGVEYDWNPPVSDKKLIQDYIESLPKEKQPVVGTEGAQYRKKQLMRQLPAHDQEPKECHDLTPQETNEMQLFVKQYREKALGVAEVKEGDKPKSCAECREPLKVGEPVIWAERAGTEKYWHPKCFICFECKELLVDLIYFYHEDKIYCGRHYCELLKPRCAACDELIFAPEYTQAEDSYWHLKHFCCWHCDEPLGGKNYVPHDNQPVCIPCYEKSFAQTCSTCKEIIAPNTEWVTFESNHWHARPECFKCSNCNKSLVGKPCIPKGDMVFCCSKCKREKLQPES